MAGNPLARAFILGAFLVSVVAAFYHWSVLAAGAVNATMGAAAEQWTSTELRRLRGRGWKSIDNFVLREGADIDHLAVGSDGVIVLETKWRSARVDATQIGWLQSAVDQALRNERDVAGSLGWGARKDTRRLTSVVVVWGPEVVHSGDGEILRTKEGVGT